MNKKHEEYLTISDIENIKRNYVLFKVPAADAYEYYPLSRDGQPIGFLQTHVDDYVIYLQPLSTVPRLLEDLSKPFVSFASKNDKALNTIKFNEVEPMEQLNHLRENLTGRLILANPKIHIDRKKKEAGELNPYFYNYEIAYISDEKPQTNSYQTIPSVVSTIDRKRFESMLKNGSNIQFRCYNGQMPSPEFVVCENILYYFPDLDTESLVPNERNILNFYCKDYSEVKRITLPYEFKDKSQCTYQGLYFLPIEYIATLRDLMTKKGTPLDRELDIVESKIIVPINSAKEEYAATNEDTINNKNSNDNTNVSKGDYVNEYHFLNALKNRMIESHLYYDETDIDSFHTAVKTNFLTILGGMSGTGKTRMAMEYANTLGLEKDKDLLIVPISPSYTEPSDILGFLNPQTGIFTESETGLASFLKKASDNPDKLYMVLFEEMNLSQVEHWFSPFISLLEMEEEHRELKLVSSKQYCVQEEFRKPIRIGKNMIFVGTANFDETTKEFSTRLLDRANVVQLKKQSFMDAKHSENEQKEVPNFHKISAKNFRSWVKPTENPLKVMNDEELRILDLIHKELQSVDSQNGVSFRIVTAMAHFINNIPVDENGYSLINRKRAFDIQICQRILTKIRGHREMLQELLGYWDPAIEDIKNGKIRDILSNFENYEENTKQGEETLSNYFSLSVEVLKQKAKELIINGYTM